MKALILIGGLGTRLRPLTCSTPKPLLPIVNKPFLEYQIDLLKRHGITDVILCISYLSHVFENYFGNGEKWGVKISYVHEKNPLGTGGAIRNASHLLDGTTLIFNGDILTDIDLTRFIAYHRAKKSCVTIALTRVKDPTAFGLIETNKKGKIGQFLEKPSWDEVTCNTINAGIYLFEPTAVDRIPAGVHYSVERGLFPSLLENKIPLFGYTAPYYWMDIGTVEKYMQAHADVMSNKIQVGMSGRKHRENVIAGKRTRFGDDLDCKGTLVCGHNTKIDHTVTFTGSVSLGNKVKIGKGVVISDSIILDGTRIDEGVKLENVLIGKHCRIEANAILSPGTVLGDKTVIRRYSKL
ncbi:MAG: NDP-sugar synthase [Endomicrobiales bacterium]